MASVAKEQSNSNATAEKPVEAVSTPDDEVDEDAGQKNPLHCKWTMFYNPASKSNNSKSWPNHVREIWTFGTVEDFWRLFNNLVAPSCLPVGSNYHLFKNGVQPEWEDPANLKGGKWSVVYNVKGEDNSKKFDDAWMWTVLALIGEFFEDSDFITGVVISPRAKFNKIALWTSDAPSRDAQMRIGQTLKTHLNIQGPLSYQSWDDAKDRRNAPMYQV